MSVTGIALVLFLTFHASMNVVALISAKGYNMICEFLGANWYAVVATIALAGLVALHFIYALWLTLQNRKARGASRYEVTSKPEKVEWASQNMFVLGIIICLGLCLHLFNFWYNMMYAELFETAGAPMAANGVFHIINTFHGKYGIIYTVLYLIWLCALWFHLTHGIWSGLQTLGWSGKIWFKRWKCISTIYATIVVLMFAVVAVAFAAGHKPCDMKKWGPGCPPAEFVCPNGEMPEGFMPGCPMGPGHHMKHPGCPEGKMKHPGCPEGKMRHPGCPEGPKCGSDCPEGPKCGHHGPKCGEPQPEMPQPEQPAEPGE